MKSTMFYTVKEVSEKTGLTPYTIRYYLKEGLFPFVERDSNGTRLFKESDLESFYMIDCMKRCGMTIQEIRQYMNWLMAGDQNIDQCLKLFQSKKDVLEKEMDKLQETLEAIEYKIWYYQTARNAGTMAVHQSMKQDEVPQRMQRIRSRMKQAKILTPKHTEK